MRILETFMGGKPPISITAHHCGEVVVNVRVVVEYREHDTLRKMAADIEERHEDWLCLNSAR